jgi:hypothetical protein
MPAAGNDSGTCAPGFGAPLVVLAGLTAAAINAIRTQQLLASRGNFAEAFGSDWQDQIPSQFKDRMLARRWRWKLAVAPRAHVERDVTFAAIPGSDRSLLADVWSPPDGVARSGLLLHLFARRWVQPSTRVGRRNPGFGTWRPRGPW